MRVVILMCVMAGMLVFVAGASGGPYTPRGPLAEPVPGNYVAPPTQVPGMEYSDDTTPITHNPGDKDGLGVADPEQVIAWDGSAGVQDSFDYSNSRSGDTLDRQVDALANHGDALFTLLINGEAVLLFSVDDENGGGVSSPYIFYEVVPPESPPPAPGGPIWATPAQIDQHGVKDVDALEVWGPEPLPGQVTGDTDRYSLYGDPLIGAQRVSVWAYDPLTNVSTPFITALQIAQAIGHEELADTIDLDALMTYDMGGDDYFGTGDSVLFSIEPIAGFDGGEIWVWSSGGPATFLSHGGHLWNTVFNVMAAFGVDSENINALEAVPEPATLALLALGGLGALLRRRKSKA